MSLLKDGLIVSGDPGGSICSRGWYKGHRFAFIYVSCAKTKAKRNAGIGIDTTEAKRALCMDVLKCDAFIDFASTKDIPAEVMRITGRGAHASIITGGTASAYANWWENLRVGGTM